MNKLLTRCGNTLCVLIVITSMALLLLVMCSTAFYGVPQ